MHRFFLQSQYVVYLMELNQHRIQDQRFGSKYLLKLKIRIPLMVLRIKLKNRNLQNAHVEFVKLLYQLQVLSNKHIYATLGLIVEVLTFSLQLLFIYLFIYLFFYFLFFIIFIIFQDVDFNQHLYLFLYFAIFNIDTHRLYSIYLSTLNKLLIK